jgi:hypothetical protein
VRRAFKIRLLQTGQRRDSTWDSGSRIRHRPATGAGEENFGEGLVGFAGHDNRLRPGNVLAISEFERDLIRDRAVDGLRRAKAQASGSVGHVPSWTCSDLNVALATLARAVPRHRLRAKVFKSKIDSA